MLKKLFCVTFNSGNKTYVALDDMNFQLAATVAGPRSVKSVELITDGLIAGPQHLMLPPDARKLNDIPVNHSTPFTKDETTHCRPFT